MANASAAFGSNTYTFSNFGRNSGNSNSQSSSLIEDRQINGIYNKFPEFNINKPQDTNIINPQLSNNTIENNAQTGITYNQNVALMYHKISNNPEELSAFCISSEEFEKDILYLKSQGFTFRTASEASNLANIQGKNVYITFDDGYDNDYHIVLPILEKHQVKATFFVIGSQLGKSDHITKEHLVELSKSPYVEIASHSYELHTKTVEEIKTIYDVENNTSYLVKDFVNNAIYIGNLIGKKVTSLSYPNGIWTSDADVALRSAGYISTFTSDEKPISNLNEPLGRFNRYPDRDAEKIITNFVAPKPPVVIPQEEVDVNVEVNAPFPSKPTDMGKNALKFSQKAGWGISNR